MLKTRPEAIWPPYASGRVFESAPWQRRCTEPGRTRDLDALDPEKAGKANEFAPAGGPSAEDLKSALDMVRERFAFAAAGIASYDPAFDPDGRVLAVVLT